jgi:hypothetical protein
MSIPTGLTYWQAQALVRTGRSLSWLPAGLQVSVTAAGRRVVDQATARRRGLAEAGGGSQPPVVRGATSVPRAKMWSSPWFAPLGRVTEATVFPG